MAEPKKTAKTTAKKTAMKAGAPAKEAVKAAAVTEEKKAVPAAPVTEEIKTAPAAPVKEAKKAAPARKAPAKKPASRKAAPKKAAEPKAAVHFQFDGKDLLAGDVLERAVAHYKEIRKGVEIKDIELYIVANEGAAYYVVNGEGSGDFKVML